MQTITMNSTEKSSSENPSHLEKAPPETRSHDFDPAAEKKLRRKIDLRLIPILSLLLLCAFVDRHVPQSPVTPPPTY